jgi:hypothetical protein
MMMILTIRVDTGFCGGWGSGRLIPRSGGVARGFSGSEGGIEGSFDLYSLSTVFPPTIM